MKLGWKLEFPKEIGSSPQWNKIPIKSVAGVTEDASSHKNSVTFEPSFSKNSPNFSPAGAAGKIWRFKQGLGSYS